MEQLFPLIYILFFCDCVQSSCVLWKAKNKRERERERYKRLCIHYHFRSNANVVGHADTSHAETGPAGALSRSRRGETTRTEPVQNLAAANSLHSRRLHQEQLVGNASARCDQGEPLAMPDEPLSTLVFVVGELPAQ